MLKFPIFVISEYNPINNLKNIKKLKILWNAQSKISINSKISSDSSNSDDIK